MSTTRLAVSRTCAQFSLLALACLIGACVTGPDADSLGSTAQAVGSGSGSGSGSADGGGEPEGGCGDGTCDGNESCTTCPSDCGTCACTFACSTYGCSPGTCCSFGGWFCDAETGCLDYTGCTTGPVCGNGTCEAGESCGSCPNDCGACPSVCGDGTCAADESCSTCPNDCGTCACTYACSTYGCTPGTCCSFGGWFCDPATACLEYTGCTPDPVCGNGTCEAGESCGSCPNDCGACPSVCGDGTCAADESCSTCPNDCGTCACTYACSTYGCTPGACCSFGGWFCDPATACLEYTGCTPDPICGDGSCNGGETCSSCATDCGACPTYCGDGTCDGNESCSTCASDCGTCNPPPPTCMGTASETEIFGNDASVLARFEWNGGASDSSGGGRNGAFLGGTFVASSFGQGLSLAGTYPQGLDWSAYAGQLTHPFTLEVVLEANGGSGWRKLFSWSDTDDRGWYLIGEATEWYAGPALGSGIGDCGRHYVVTRSTSATSADVLVDGVLVGNVPLQYTAPSGAAIFFEDDAGTGRAEMFEGVIDGLRISNVARTNAEIQAVQARLDANACLSTCGPCEATCAVPGEPSYESTGVDYCSVGDLCSANDGATPENGCLLDGAATAACDCGGATCAVGEFCNLSALVNGDTMCACPSGAPATQACSCANAVCAAGQTCDDATGGCS